MSGPGPLPICSETSELFCNSMFKISERKLERLKLIGGGKRRERRSSTYLKEDEVGSSRGREEEVGRGELINV